MGIKELEYSKEEMIEALDYLKRFPSLSPEEVLTHLSIIKNIISVLEPFTQKQKENILRCAGFLCDTIKGK